MAEKLLIVSMSLKASLFLKKNLDDVFANKIEIEACSFLETSKALFLKALAGKPLLAIATGNTSYNELIKYFPASKCLLGKRYISTPESLDKLFDIPKGKKVLVVNATKNGTLETIEAIKRLGITHLSYIPYWENCDINIGNLDTAISPGMLIHCPESIQNKIDIGMRNLSAETFLKILEKYNLKNTYIDKYILTQKKVLVETNKQLSLEKKSSDLLRETLQTTLDVLDEAIISIDANSNITSFNYSASQILNISANEVLHKNIKSVFNDISAGFSLKKKIGFITTINNHQFYLSYTPLSKAITNAGIFKLSKIKDIQKNEEIIRKMLYQKYKGHVAKYTFSDILAESPSMEKLIDNAKLFAKTESTILITGESGTGKELLAQAIHNYSKRSDKPFIAVNFAAIPENILESELFGYEEGAFTGAKKGGKKGLFELAHTGTIFLDEIGYSSLRLQTRLLRVLEERTIMRLGDTKVIPVDIRIIVATNKNLKKMVSENNFLADLYFRINVFQLHLIPLRKRKESIPKLINKLMLKQGLTKIFSQQALEKILEYSWFGNIRELKNMIEYSVEVSQTNIINIDDLPHDILIHKSSENSMTPSTENNLFENICCNLKALFDLEYIVVILLFLSQNNAGLVKVGRSKMLNFLKEKNVFISDRKLRVIMQYLYNYGFVLTGKTKQGTVISSDGEKFLQYILTTNKSTNKI